MFINNIEFFPTKYEGYYISKSGLIISFRSPASKNINKRFDLNRKPKYLKYKTDKDGYFEITFSINKKRYSKKVHQIVAETFLGECPEGHCVDHIDRNRTNNNLNNLRYLPWSLNSDGQTGKITKACKKCFCNGKIYSSILKACKDNNINYSSVLKYPNKHRKLIYIEGVETIEIF